MTYRRRRSVMVSSLFDAEAIEAGDTCETKEGLEGTCRMVYECLNRDTGVQLCGKGPLACCPDSVPAQQRVSRQKSHIYLSIHPRRPWRKPIRAMMIRRRKRRPTKKTMIHMRKPAKPFRMVYPSKPAKKPYTKKPAPQSYSYSYKYGTPESEVMKYNMETFQDLVQREPAFSSNRDNDLAIFPEESEAFKDGISSAGSVFHAMFGRQPAPATKRISQIKCDEYKNLATETIAELSKFGMVPKKIDKCSVSDLETISGIAGRGEFPHVAGLGYDDDGEMLWECGGSLISEQYVLTAAHCVQSPAGRPVKVGLGEIRLGGDWGDIMELGISEVIVHPLYNSSARYNDIALIKLAKKVKVSETVRPACLQWGSDYQKTAVATHWDPIQSMSLEIRMKPNLTHRFTEGGEAVGLRKSMYSILDSMDCGIPSDVKDSLLCVSTETPNPTCSVGGGGGLQVKHADNKCMYTIIGVASLQSCEQPTLAAYTRVAHFLPWIESIVWT